MENTRENKAKFFAQYLGTQITYPDTDDKLITCKLHGVTFSEVETIYKRKKKGCVGDILSFKSNGNHNSDAINAYLELKPLSLITNDELGAIARFYNRTATNVYIDNEQLTFDYYHGDETHSAAIELNSGYCLDYLRNNGFAAEWMGLTVEEQIKFGWVKLKTI
ncbi:hypothetical protein [Epilithonimonas caeni]|uniref:hypothetical protein n=1 Tax=Epilithonimonas caeni TaxID=365343 RepID=UPI0004027C84|nr:hypothetical protein [Epilithonimonas caeni]